MELITSPWPWWVAGPLMAFVMFGLLYFGNSFGVSGNFRTMCTIMGAGKTSKFFDFDWKKQIWNLVFILGALIGGFIASQWLMPDTAIGISEVTKTDLIALGISNPGETILPSEVFSFESLLTLRGIIIIVVGGFLVGFGTRYAGGCTSGHAISGLSNLQPASLIAVIGFFIGGIIMTWLLLPSIYSL